MAKRKTQNNIKKQVVKDTSSKKSIWEIVSEPPFPYLIILLAIILIYFRNFSFQMGKLDEDLIILNNFDFLKNIGNLKEAFFRDAFLSTTGIPFYRPLQNVTYMFDAFISGGSHWSFYMTNVLIHFVTCSFVFYILKTLFKNFKVSLLVTLFFAVNPFFVHSVSWIPSRGDLLITMFAVIAFGFLITYYQLRKNYLLILHIAAVAFAVFSKETAMLLPVLFLIYIIFKEKRIKFSKTNIILTVSYFIIGIGYLLLRSSVVKISNSDDIFGLTPFLDNLPVLPEILGKFFVPFNLSPTPAFHPLNIIFGIAIIAAIIILFIRLKDKEGFEKYGWLFYGYFWFVLLNIPAMLFTHNISDTSYKYQESRGYLPSIGIVIILASLLGFLIKKYSKQIINIFIPILLFFLGYSYVYNLNYKTPLSFYDLAIITNPKSSISYNNRGIIKKTFGDKSGALRDYDSTVSLNSRVLIAYYNRGVVRSELNMSARAIEDFTEFIRTKKDYPSAYNFRGLEYKKIGKMKEAITDFNEVLRLKPGDTEALNSIGICYAMSGDLKNALHYFNEIIKIKPNDYEVYANRGNVRHALGDVKGAIQDWKVAADHGNQAGMQSLKNFNK